MKKWISLCLALTLVGNTALFGAEKIKKEMPRNSLLAYAKPVAKIILGLGGACIISSKYVDLPEILGNFWKYSLLRIDQYPKVALELLPTMLCAYVALQGMGEYFRTSKEQGTEVVTQEESQETADEVKKEAPRNSLSYGKSIAKIVFGLGGALISAGRANFRLEEGLLPTALGGYVALQGVQELVEQISPPKEQETEVVAQEESQIN